MGMQTMQVQQPMNQSSGKGNAAQPQLTQTNPVQPRSVEDLYRMYSDRAPDAQGLAYWRGQFGNNIDQNAINTFKSSVQDVWNKEGKPADYASSVWSSQSGQPRFGQPNQYSNTLRPWDNANIAPQYSTGGKGGKGGGMQSNYPVARTNWSYSLPSNTNQPQFQQPTSNASNVGYGSDYSGA